MRYCTCVFIGECVFQLQHPDSFVQSKSVIGDPDPIRIHVRYGPNTQAIQRPIHEMTRRSVLVHAVKIERRFDSETASLHVSVCSYVIFFFTVIVFYSYYFI